MNSQPPLIYSDSLFSNVQTNVIKLSSVISSNQLVDLSVNQASVKQILNSFPIMQTKIFTNNVGSFNGGGTGNKCIMGVNSLNNLSLSNFENIDINFLNVQGSVAPVYEGGGGIANQSPLVNLQVHLSDTLGTVLLILIDYSQNPVLNTGIYETFIQNGQTVFQATWNNELAVTAVGVFPNQGYKLGGIEPVYSAGNNPNITYWRFSDIVAANPNAKLVNTFTGDGGLPVGMTTSALMLVSGDSNQQVFSSKIITVLNINNKNIIS